MNETRAITEQQLNKKAARGKNGIIKYKFI